MQMQEQSLPLWGPSHVNVKRYAEVPRESHPVPEPLGEVGRVGGPGAVEALQPLHVAVAEGQAIGQLVESLQVRGQAAQLQQVNLGPQHTLNVNRFIHLGRLYALSCVFLTLAYIVV